VKLQFERVNDVPGDWVRRYLGAQGWEPALTEWKYFDEGFNRGRTRGFAWVQGDGIRGLIGMIPAALAHDGGRWPASWACDWSIESPAKTPGVGVFLFQSALRHEPRFIATGGNHNSLPLFHRLARRTFPEAAVDYHIPLRLEALMDMASRRAPALRIDRWPLLGRVPLNRFRRRPGRVEVRVEEGVPAAVAPLIEGPRGPGWHPVYEFGHVQWAVARCPILESATAYVPSGSGTRAAVIFWRPRKPGWRWRASLWAGSDGQEPLAACLAEALRRIRSAGGALLSVMISRLDTDFAAVLRGQGGFAGAKTPIFLFRTDGALEGFEAPTRLSYHDSDYTVLF